VIREDFMRRLFIAAALSAAGVALAGCDPYAYGPGPAPYGGAPDAGYPGAAYPAAGGPVSFLGCPIPGSQPNCQSARSIDGQVFDISSAGTRPAPGSPFAIEVSGVPGPAYGYCQGAPALQNVTVRQTNLRCVSGMVQGYPQPQY
jgi:hypothetical protein